MSNEVVVLYQDDDLLVEGELIKGNPFLHCTVLDFKKSTMVKALDLWEDIKIGFYLEGYDEIFSVSKNKRFIKFIRGVLHKELDGEVGVYKWELK